MNAVVAVVHLHRVAALALAIVPAAVLGFCAGRLRPVRRERVDAALAEQEPATADLALARDPHANGHAR
jgi:hypothetical protein